MLDRHGTLVHYSKCRAPIANARGGGGGGGELLLEYNLLSVAFWPQRGRRGWLV